MYTITVDRKSAIYYWAWEFGLARAIERAKANRGSRVTLDFGTDLRRGRWKRKRDAEAWAQRVREAVAFVQGKLRPQPSTWCSALIEIARESK